MKAPEADARRDRIWAVRQALGAHGIGAEVAESEPVLCIAGACAVTIRCDRRASDEGRLWLYDVATTEPIAQADAAHLHELITWAKAKLAEPLRGPDTL